MRDLLHTVLRDYFRSELLKTHHNTEGMTQERMASILEMSTRAYADLESGKSCCSAETLVLYLRRLCPDAQAFFSGLYEKIEETMRSADENALNGF